MENTSPGSSSPKVSEEEAAILFQSVLDPLLRATSLMVNKMRLGDTPVDIEFWNSVRQVLYGAFDIPPGTLPDDPRELKQPLSFGSPYDGPPILESSEVH